jgi:hypothetical protein
VLVCRRYDALHRASLTPHRPNPQATGQLLVTAAHCPLLRWAHWYRGGGTNLQLAKQLQPETTSLTCRVAGLQGVPERVVGMLQPWEPSNSSSSRPRVCSLQVFAATQPAVGASDMRSTGVAAAAASSQQQQEPAEVWCELHMAGLSQRDLRAAARSLAAAGGESCDASPAAPTAAAAGAEQPQTRLVQASPFSRRRDLAEQLLRHGLARLAEPEDFAWLGVRPSRIRAYTR